LEKIIRQDFKQKGIEQADQKRQHSQKSDYFPDFDMDHGRKEELEHEDQHNQSGCSDQEAEVLILKKTHVLMFFAKLALSTIKKYDLRNS
jgi:hypothetical protein